LSAATSGGHLHGGGSIGKTTALRCAALIFGAGKIGSADNDVASCEYFVLSEPFKELCKGVGDPKHVARVLAERGHLIAGEPGRLSRKEWLPGMGPTRCYKILPSLFDDDLID